MVSGKVAGDIRMVCSFQELQCLEQMERLVLPSGVLQTIKPLRCVRDCVCMFRSPPPSANNASKIFYYRVDFWLETMCLHIACWESVKVAARDTVAIFPEEKSTDAREMEKVLAKALHLKIKTSMHQKVINLTGDWIPVLKRDQTWQLWHHVADSP